jgi:hypothetical protein
LVLGFTDEAIKHRLARGRLRRIYKGVSAVGQLPLTQQGRWMAAVLACGETAALSHDSAGALWRLMKTMTGTIHVSFLSRSRSRKGIVVHQRRELDVVRREGIAVTSVAQTLIDLGRHPDIEQAIGEAILRRLVTLRALRTAATRAGKSGAPLRSVIDRVTFRVTQSELEREFLRLVERAGLPLPQTQTRFGRYRVDFAWPAIGLASKRTAAASTPPRSSRPKTDTAALLADVFTACQCRQGSASSKRAA